MSDEPIIIVTGQLPIRCGVGMLGATFDQRGGMIGAQAAQAEMIERRILRIEMALRRAGIEVETFPLPEPVR